MTYRQGPMSFTCNSSQWERISWAWFSHHPPWRWEMFVRNSSFFFHFLNRYLKPINDQFQLHLMRCLIVIIFQIFQCNFSRCIDLHTIKCAKAEKCGETLGILVFRLSSYNSIHPPIKQSSWMRQEWSVITWSSGF